MAIYVLLIIMIVITIFIYKFFKQELISPALGFTLPFTISILWLIFNIERWSVTLNWNTCGVIIGGTISYLIGVFSATIFTKRNKKNVNLISKSESQKFLLFIFLIFELVSLLICFQSILRVASSYGYTGSIANKIYGYRCLGIYTTNNISLGKIPDLLYSFNVASGYIWAYLIVNDIVSKSKKNPILFINIILSIITAFIKGGRQSAIQLLFSSLVMYIILNNKKKKQNKTMSLKSIFLLILFIVIILFTFQKIGTLLGRTVQADFFQYLSVYLSGGIKNLNNYLMEEHLKPEIFGKMTFIYLIRYLGHKLHRPEFIYTLDLPYQTANGLNTGNIYTTFYAYIYDFGYIGVIILPFIIGLIAQYYYLKTKNDEKRRKKINLSIIIYSYIFYTLAFSFFSNKFYEAIFSINFLKFVIIWSILSFILEKVRIKVK